MNTYKIYISPSLQPTNKYADNSGSEQKHMQTIGRKVVELLKRHKEFVVFANRVGMTLKEAVRESNSLVVNAHIAIHSNAGSGEGTEVWYYKGSTNGKKLAEAIYQEVAPLSPGKDRGVKDTKGFYEVRQTKAPAVIVEVEFHNKKKLAEWIGQHHEELAQGIYKGICNYFAVEPIDDQPIDIIPIKVHAKGKVYSGELRNGKTMVHVRVLEEFGLKVDWDGKDVWVSQRTATPKVEMSRLRRRKKYDVITCYPSQVEVTLIKGKIPISKNGVNGGFVDRYLNPLGLVIIDGKLITAGVVRVPIRPCLVITKNNKAQIDYLNGTEDRIRLIKYALGGAPTLLKYDAIKGVIQYPTVGMNEGVQGDIINSVRERTAVGITSTGLVKLVTTDPMDIEELATTMKEIGCINAMALDGGDSTAMVWNEKIIRGNKRANSTAIFVKK